MRIPPRAWFNVLESVVAGILISHRDNVPWLRLLAWLNNIVMAIGCLHSGYAWIIRAYSYATGVFDFLWISFIIAFFWGDPLYRILLELILQLQLASVLCVVGRLDVI